MSMDARGHVEHLAAVIGPRGSCTPEERRASEYCRGVLRDLGFEAHLEEFRATRSGWAPFSVAAGLVLLGLAAFWLLPDGIGAPLAAALTVTVTASLLLHLTFRPNPLVRLVPTGISQNVYARARPTGPVRRTIVVCGHVDTHRTPIAMYSPLAFRLFVGLTTVGLLAIGALCVLFILAAVRPDPLWRLLTLPPGVVALVVFAVTLQPEFTRFVPGANDNASGAAAVLALAARLRAQPLPHTEVWLLNSGAEEVGATGPVRLLERHPELRAADWIVLDTIAGPGAGPCVITAEQVLLPLRADSRLLALAQGVAAVRPDLKAYEHYYRGLFSEHSPLVAAGCRSLAMIGFTPQGVLPHWHRPTDTVANIDPGVLERTIEFAWELLAAIDRQA
jgi:hypothetical protein